MKVTVVGCAGSFPGPDSPASCYLVEHDGYSVVLDLGNGALGPLQRYTDIDRLDAVVLSHLHVDHCIDVCSYYVARKYRPGGPLGTVPVIGPAGTANRMANAYDLPLEPGMHGEFEFVDHSAAPVQLGPFRLSVSRVAHPVEAYALRLDVDGRSVVYSGDTATCESLVDLARGADLALFEASFLDDPANPRGLHMSASDAARLADRAGVGRLVLTHLVAWNPRERSEAEARAVYDGDLVLAETGQAFVL